MGLALVTAPAGAADWTVREAASVIGHNPAEIHQRFPGVIWENLNHKGRMRNWSLKDIDLLAKTYGDANGGDPEELEAVIRANSPKMLKAYQQAVAAYRAQVRPVKPIVVPTKPIVLPTPLIPPRPIGGLRGWVVRGERIAPRMRVAPPPAISIDNTLHEIYLFYRSAAGGSLSAEAALWETARFAGAELGYAATAGDTIGTGMAKTWEYLDPEGFARFGQDVASIVDGYQSPLDWQMSIFLAKNGDPYSMADLQMLQSTPPDIVLGAPEPGGDLNLHLPGESGSTAGTPGQAGQLPPPGACMGNCGTIDRGWGSQPDGSYQVPDSGPGAPIGDMGGGDFGGFGPNSGFGFNIGEPGGGHCGGGKRGGRKC